MCTVSFVPTKGGHVFTFSRDEMPLRKTPYFEASKNLGFKNVYYPQDVKSGGSWFVVDDWGNVAMLFNGGFSKHEKQSYYKKSRGIILLELVSEKDMLSYFTSSSFDGIEPFSIILFENESLYRLVWDGEKKHTITLDKNTNHIFSSATLYTDEIKEKRKDWLYTYLKGVEHINEEAIFNFHATYNSSDTQNGLIINREKSCSTLSISQVYLSQQQCCVKHVDLLAKKVYQKNVFLNVATEV
jgi:hypothetical protein